MSSEKKHIQAHYGSEDDIWKRLCQKLDQGVAHKNHPWNKAVVSTVSEQWPFSEARTVILRNFEAHAFSLDFHSDWRAPKITQLRQNTALVWLFYDENEKEQLRIAARAEIHHNNDKALAAWRLLHPGSKKIYCSNYPPGSILKEGTPVVPQKIQSRRLSDDEVAFGFRNFCRVVTRAETIDWLKIANTGEQYRMKFQRNGSGRFTGVQVAP